MRILKTLLFKNYLLLLVLIPSISFSQVVVKGEVKDVSSDIPYANVILKSNGGTIAGGAITNEDGTFEISIAAGTYSLEVSFLGYQNHQQDIVLSKAVTVLDDIILVEEEATLGEVTVIAKKNLIQRKVDRLVYNIENNVATSGGNALDALKVSPGVAVNEDQVSIIGKSSIRVMINGRLIQLNGEALIAFLASIPADDIKEIEIITNPPARYEAVGNSGLINIIYKKGRRNSWSNRTSATYIQSFLPRYSLRNNFKYQKDKVNVLLSLDGSDGDLKIERDIEIGFNDGLWEIDRDDKFNTQNLSGRLLFDYNINEKSVIGVQYLGSVSNPDPSQTTTSSTTIFNNSNQVDSLLTDDGRSRQMKNTHSLNVHYNTPLDTLGKSLSIDLDYFIYNAEDTRNVITKSFLPDNTLLNTIFSNLNNSQQDIDNYSATIDFEHPLKLFNLSYGAKFSFTNSAYITDNFNTISGSPIFNPDVSDDFEYSENNQAFYINGSKKFGEKWNTQIGLRVENTQTEGVSNTLEQTNENDYLKLFPTFYLTYILNENNNFSINYGRRINRPLYYQLNPARTFVSSVNSVVGNPQLQPSFTDNFELSHVYNQKLSTSLFYSVETDGFGEIADTSEDTNEQIFVHQNYFTHYNYGLSTFYTFNKISWWESQNSLYLIGNKSQFSITDGIIAEPQNGFRYYFSTNNTFNLNEARTLKGQINHWYSSSYKSNLFEFDERYSIDAVVRVDLLDKRLQMSLGVYDIFNTSFRRTTSVTNGIKQVQAMFPSNRYLRFTLTYDTGNNKINVRQRRFGNEDEKGRVGN